MSRQRAAAALWPDRRDGDTGPVADRPASRPGVALGAYPERRESLCNLGDTLVRRVVQSALSQPEADATVLLGYWSGDANHALLVELADRTIMLDGEALRAEFVGAVDQLIANFARSQRRDLVTGLHEDASKEKLEAYWEARKQRPQDSADSAENE